MTSIDPGCGSADPQARMMNALGRIEDGAPAASVVVEPEIVSAASELAEVVTRDKSDRFSTLLIGLFHWQRYLSAPAQRDQDLSDAVGYLLPIFLSGELADLPHRLLPALANSATAVVYSLMHRNSTWTSLDGIDLAVQWCELVTTYLPAGHPDRCSWLSNYAHALLARFDQTAETTDWEAALRSSHGAVEVIPTGHPDEAKCWVSLVAVLHRQSDMSGTDTDLDELVQVGNHAAEIVVGGPNQMVVLGLLADALRLKFHRTQVLRHLDAAIRTYGALAAAADDLDAPLFLAERGNLLRIRAAHTGELQDFHAAVRSCRQAVARAGVDNPSRGAILASLADALRVRFGQTGTLRDANQAIKLARRARAATPPDHPHMTAVLMVLGSALQDRYMRTGSMDDLEESIEMCMKAAGIATTGHLASCLSTLGNGMRLRYRRTRAHAHLEETVQTATRAVEAAAPDDSERGEYLANLGNALQERYFATAAEADLHETIRVGTEAAATNASDSERAWHLANLANAYRWRAIRNSNIVDLQAAILIGQKAVDSVARQTPDRAAHLADLARSLLLQNRHGSNRTRMVLQEVVDISVAEPSVRILAARALADLVSTTDTHHAADLLELAVRLLTELAPQQLRRADQQHALSGYTGLASDAAALKLRDTTVPDDERAQMALRLLESGRAVTLTQTLQTRSDITELAQHHPKLAREFLRLRTLLDQSSPTALLDQSMPATGFSDRPIRRDRHQLADAFATQLRKIRALPGFESFAAPPPVEELLPQAEYGPLVVLNTSQYGSDALLVMSREVTRVPLPQLDVREASNQVSAFHRAVRTANRGETSPERRAAQQRIQQTLEWLWDTVTGPVLRHLGFDHPCADQELPHVWWIAGGLLGLLPLHAAGYHDQRGTSVARTVMDVAISSYTPTIGALRHARQRLASASDVPSEPPKAVIVAMPITPGTCQPPLHHVQEEVAVVAGHLDHSLVLGELDGDAREIPNATGRPPTRGQVLESLAECGIAHFACHGTNDSEDPSLSALLLHDHRTAPLTVAALTEVEFDHARLAFLSACDTALSGNNRLLDESIHLASAFQIVGYPHVIGTLWALDDEAAVEIADAFYAGLRHPIHGTIDFDCAAAALNSALRAARHNYPALPSLWAAHLHAGA